MYYFAMLAILAGYCDWVVILAAAGTVALHHLTLNFVAPALIFPGGTDFARVLLHAVIVVFEAAALVWMCWQVTRLFAAATDSLAVAEKARDATRVAQAEQSRLQAEAEAARRQTLADVASRLESELRTAVTGMATAAQALRARAVQMASDADRAAARGRRCCRMTPIRPAATCKPARLPSRSCRPQSRRSPARSPPGRGDGAAGRRKDARDGAGHADPVK